MRLQSLWPSHGTTLGTRLDPSSRHMPWHVARLARVTLRSFLRAANGPQVMAALRNLAITTRRLSGATHIAAALRHHTRDTTDRSPPTRSRNHFARALSPGWRCGQKGAPIGVIASPIGSPPLCDVGPGYSVTVSSTIVAPAVSTRRTLARFSPAGRELTAKR